FAGLPGCLLYGRSDTYDEKDNDRHHRERDQSEVPTQDEHRDQQSADCEYVNRQGDCAKCGESLDRRHVRGDGAQNGTDLVSLVITQGKALKVVVHPYPQIVGDPLTDTRREVSVEING